MASNLPHKVRAVLILPRLTDPGLARIHLASIDYTHGGKALTAREHYTATVIVDPNDDLHTLVEIMAGALEQFSHRR
jgi:hypothetical protein